MASSFKTFDMSLENIQIENNNLFDTSVKTTMRRFYDVGLCDRFEEKMKFFKIILHF